MTMIAMVSHLLKLRITGKPTTGLRTVYFHQVIGDFLMLLLSLNSFNGDLPLEVNYITD